MPRLLHHHHAAAQAANGAAFTRVEQVRDQNGRCRKHAPDQIIDCIIRRERHWPDRDRRYAGDAIVAAERFQIAEQKIDRQSPGNGAERQEMSAEPKRDCAEQSGDNPRQRESKQKPQPGRGALCRRQPSGCISADADEGCLAERSQSADAGEQHYAKRHQRIDADIVEQRDGEFGGPEGRRQQDSHSDNDDDHAGAGDHPSTSASSSSVCSSDNERQSNTGISTLKTVTSLNELLQKDAKLSSSPIRTAPIAVPG